MGHIKLAAPVSHIWYFKGIPSRMGLILDISPRTLEKVLYLSLIHISMLEGDRRFGSDESLGAYGYQEQEFKNNELVAVEEEAEVAEDDEYTMDDDVFLSDEADDFADDGEEE